MRPLQGVQSNAWIERSNLLVMVGGGQYRSMATIDRICLAPEPAVLLHNFDKLQRTLDT